MPRFGISPGRGRLLGRRLMKYLLLPLLAYAAVVALAYFLQNSFLYFPDRYAPEDLPRVAGLPLQPWPDPGSYRGFLGSEPPSAPVRGLMIVFHGNAGSARHRTYYVDALAPLGFRVLLAEYPGYGARAGAPGEASLIADARETVLLARRLLPGPIYLWGESLGCAVASATARDAGAEIGGMVLLTPWADLPRLAQAVYPFLPARWLVRDRYDNLANLKGFRRPAAVLAAGADEIIPASHSRDLYRSLGGPKMYRVFPGAGHNTWPANPGENWWREVADFISAADGLPGPGARESFPSGPSQ